MLPGSRPSAPINLDGDAFDDYYFRNCCGRPYGYDEHWTRFFARVADVIVRDIAPRRVLDAGCAMGILVDALRARDVDAWGIDLSPYAIDHCHDSVRPFCRVGSIDAPFDQHYDLICCIEVVEHMAPHQAEATIANLCRHTDDVLFSSSSEDFAEPTHINVRPPEYWAELFAHHGLYRDSEFPAECVSPWAVRFRRRTDAFPKIVRGFERRMAALGRENVDLRATLLAAQERFAANERHSAEQEAALLAEIEALRTRVADLDVRARAATAAEHEARAALETVRNMERSLFWKLRRFFGRR